MAYEGVPQEKFKRVWSHVLSDYTKARLSNEDDRLSALAGIAQLLGHHEGYKSSFGLWLPIFLNELLWYTWMGERDNWKNRKDTQAIPSWSWLSLQTS